MRSILKISKYKIIVLVFLLIYSCGDKNELELEVVEKNQTLKYLNQLSDVANNALTNYDELNTFLKAKSEFIAGNYESSFSTFLQLLYYYTPSRYETEALYYVGTMIPIILKQNPSYIKESYDLLHAQMTESGDLADDFSIETFYLFLGISVDEDDYSLDYNYAPLQRILDSGNDSIIPEDDLYYAINIGSYQDVMDESNKQEFMLNINRLSFFSDMYRTSDKQELILKNEKYFPKNLPFKLNYQQNLRYQNLLKKVNERIDNIKPKMHKEAYVIGDRVRIRDRVLSSSIDDTITIDYLNDYDSVIILDELDVKFHGKKEPDKWVLVKYSGVYGDIVGFSYARYFEDASKIDDDVYKNFTQALEHYNNYRYIEASDGFSYVLAKDNTNYFTDKSSYLLWKVNSDIARLISSKGSSYYEYAKKYPNYFMYDDKNDSLKSSMLLYSFLINTVPSSTLKFKISGESDSL